MVKAGLLVGVLWLAAASVVHAAEGIGFRQTLLNGEGPRALPVALWYPTQAQAATTRIGDNRVLVGTDAQENASPVSEPRPLLLLSHGYGGSWRSVNWLASMLAAQGYIVAAPDHPGTSTGHLSAQQAPLFAQRPRDLTRIIDALTANAQLAGRIDPHRMAAIGHSLGGWTVTALAGARMDPARFAADCQTHATLWACRFVAEHPIAAADVAASMHDSRVRAVVTLDLGLARGFTPQSLATMRVPMLVIAAGTDVGDMPAAQESGYLMQHLPAAAATYVEIPDAMHFSFMQRCQPGAGALLAADRPGDDILCKDGGTRPRDAIHQDIAQRVSHFLADALTPSP